MGCRPPQADGTSRASGWLPCPARACAWSWVIADVPVHSDRSACLSSWEAGAGFALGTGREARTPCAPRAGRVSAASRHVEGRSGCRPTLCHLSSHAGQVLPPTWPGTAASISWGPLPVSPLPPCLGRVNRMAPTHLPLLGSESGEPRRRPDPAPLMVCELVEAAAAARP